MLTCLDPVAPGPPPPTKSNGRPAAAYAEIPILPIDYYVLYSNYRYVRSVLGVSTGRCRLERILNAQIPPVPGSVSQSADDRALHRRGHPLVRPAADHTVVPAHG